MSSPECIEKVFSLILIDGDKVLLLKKNSFHIPGSSVKCENDFVNAYPPELYFDFPSLVFSENDEPSTNASSSKLIGLFLPKFLGHFFKPTGGKASLAIQNKISYLGSYKTPNWGMSKYVDLLKSSVHF